MHSKLYNVEVVSRTPFDHNYIHQVVNYRMAIPAELEVGERGWFFYKLDEDEYVPWHRVHTSIVLDVKEEDKKVIVTTENSIYTFTEIEE